MSRVAFGVDTHGDLGTDRFLCRSEAEAQTEVVDRIGREALVILQSRCL